MIHKIIDVVARQTFLDPNTILPETTLEKDLDMDRVDRLALQIGLEDALRIGIDTDKMCAFETIADIEKYAMTRRQVKGTA